MTFLPRWCNSQFSLCFLLCIALPEFSWAGGSNVVTVDEMASLGTHLFASNGIQRILHAGMLNVKDERGETLLHAAVEAQSITCLLSTGSTEKKFSEEETCRVVDLLLAAGVDPNVRTRDTERTALDEAILLRKSQVAQTLLSDRWRPRLQQSTLTRALEHAYEIAKKNGSLSQKVAAEDLVERIKALLAWPGGLLERGVISFPGAVTVVEKPQ